MVFTSDVVIGIEVHISLDTKTKLFCGCKNPEGDEEPNSVTCEICLGHPGSKPVTNKKALEFTTKLALGLGCTVANKAIFSRKSYFYPDLSKNYQITQYEIPIGSGGSLVLPSGKKIGIVRAHLEEDPAALVHPSTISDSAFVLIDYNRSGVPLVEVVTAPDMTSAEEARAFMKQIVTLLDYLKIFDVNTGVIKADANISIRESGYVRSEIKNITGFKEIERALNYEIERQKREVSSGNTLIQDTRGWDEKNGKTIRLRTKETEDDYGYIIDPDLVPIDLSQFEDNIVLPELPHTKAHRFVVDYSIHNEDAHILCAEPELGTFYDDVAKEIDPLMAAKWCRHQLVKAMNKAEMNFKESKLTAENFIELLNQIVAKKVTDNVGEEILLKLVKESFSVSEYVEQNNLGAVSDEIELKSLCQQAIDENPNAVEDYKRGEEKSFNFLVGKVMQKTKGKADPGVVNNLLKELIG
jgi:aspartyl-tRNA(Asn)/glutamyl-tRNA(Gln) amidotransferase subunit B